jgi:hypothetical protein
MRFPLLNATNLRQTPGIIQQEINKSSAINGGDLRPLENSILNSGWNPGNQVSGDSKGPLKL